MMEGGDSLTTLFDDTAVAFAHKSDKELRFSHLIYKLMTYPWLVNFFSSLALVAVRMKLPIQMPVKATIYRQFCGGTSLEACDPTTQMLSKHGVQSILDYSAEVKKTEEDFLLTFEELKRTILHAKDQTNIPVTCLKVTGLTSFDLLERLSTNEPVTSTDETEKKQLYQRLEALCLLAKEQSVPIYIDAEETWIQPAIDALVEYLMATYNKERAVVFTTIQLYRKDRLSYFQQLVTTASEQGFKVGVKLVRGAYMEKERERAMTMGYPSPIQESKEATDQHYNAALKTCVEHIDVVEVCVGTHNEFSCAHMAQLMQEQGIANDDRRILFSQLYGMRDNISMALARKGFNVAKYIPYGPVLSAVPYLIRRSQENTSISGQMGRELRLLHAEMKRRKEH